MNAHESLNISYIPTLAHKYINHCTQHKFNLNIKTSTSYLSRILNTHIDERKI